MAFINKCNLFWLQQLRFFPDVGFSQYFPFFMREAPDLTGIHFPQVSEVSKNHREFVELLKARLESVGKTVLNLQKDIQEKRKYEHDKQNQKSPPFKEGLMVYLLSPDHSALKTSSSKIQFKYIRPLAINTLLSNKGVILQDLQGKLLKNTYHTCRLKVAWLRIQNQVINSLEGLKAIASPTL